jgi:thiosulfate dehydrogenase (quinone) large subunit
MNHKAAAYGLLRVTLGVIFLFYGAGKFMGGVSNFAAGMTQRFNGKLPAAMVTPFAYVLPFGEVIAGLLILLGLFTRAGLTLSGLLLIALTFGTVMLGDAPSVAHNLQYAAVNFFLLWLLELNRYSLDEIFARKTPAGFTPTK